jgi:hypothetical protein
LQNIPTQNTGSRNRKRELPVNGTKDFDLNESVARATEEYGVTTHVALKVGNLLRQMEEERKI